MKKIIYISVMLAVGFMMSSCNAWLDDVKQTATVSDEIVWQDEASVDKYVYGFYTYLDKYGQFGNLQFSRSLTESLTDTFKYGSVSLGDRAGHPNAYVLDPSLVSPDGCRYSIWNVAYDEIRRMNQFLALQKKYSSFSEEKNALWEAQVRFFRAFVYFQLAKRHDGVILYDCLPKSNDKARATSEQTWDFIEQDLNYAISILPESWDAKHRGLVTKWAALAFKSRAMLYAERWEKAMNAADKVIESGNFALEEDYANAWKGQNKEAILEFAYNAQVNIKHDFDRAYVPKCDGFDFGALGTPTQEMVESYETADGKKVDWSPWHVKGGVTQRPPYEKLEPRFHATVIYKGSVWKGKIMDCSVGGKNGEFMSYREQPYSYGKTTTGYFLRKLLDEKLIDVQNVYSSQTWVEIRYAEVLLNKAEAAYRFGKLSEAQDAMNEVRARVGLPAKYSTGEEWFKDYCNERKVELSYEGHLFWDMRRWKLAHIAYNGYRCHGMKIMNNLYEWVDVDYQDRKFSKKLYVLPIPNSEIKTNGLIKQYEIWL